MGLTALPGFRHDFTVNQGGMTSDPQPGTVGVPGQRASVRVFAVRQSLLIQIRKPVDLRQAFGVVLVHDVDLHFAKTARQLYLLFRGNMLG